MTNIVRRDPLAIDNLFDDLMKGFFVRPMRFFGGEAPLQIRMDVKEGENAYTLHAELPGVRKEDISVNVEGTLVSLSAEVKRESERKEGEEVIQSERYFGRVSRSFTLAHEVDETQAKAKFENGILEVTLPKKTPTPTRRLTVE